MVRSFIFDIGNVLIPFDFDRAIRRIASQCPNPLDALPPEAKPLIEAYESGHLSRTEFLAKSFALLEYRGTESDFIAAWEDIFEENMAMTRLVEKLQERYPLYLLSNTSDIHANYFETQYPVFKHFSDAVYSYRAGCIKPGHPIFEIAARQFSVEPSETVFIDDMPANVAAARELGFQAIQYDYRKHHCLLDELTALGVDGVAE